ncbi:MAG: Nitrilotriacetate monooxygenase component B, partial [uncultured Solirubrobacteraceae bacterium]
GRRPRALPGGHRAVRHGRGGRHLRGTGRPGGAHDERRVERLARSAAPARLLRRALPDARRRPRRGPVRREPPAGRPGGPGARVRVQARPRGEVRGRDAPDRARRARPGRRPRVAGLRRARPASRGGPHHRRRRRLPRLQRRGRRAAALLPRGLGRAGARRAPRRVAARRGAPGAL